MKKATYKIEFVRGDSYELFGRAQTKVFNSGTGLYEPGPFRDLTGWTGRAQARVAIVTTSVLFSFDVTIGNQSTALGTFFLSALPAYTKNLTDAQLKGVWDLEWTSPDGKIITPVGGTFELDPDVSRD